MRFRIVEPDRRVATGEADTLQRTDFWQNRMRYTLTNARPEAVTVEVTQSGLDDYWDDSRIISETVRSERLSSDRVVWRVPVPANGTVNLDVTFQTRF